MIKNPRLKALSDSVEMLVINQSEYQDELGAYKAEMQVIKANIVMKGSNENLSAEELKSMADFHRERIMELNKIQSGYQRKLAKINSRITALNQQLNELNYEEKTRSNQIIVIVDTDEAVSTNITLKYIISNCGWQANYDLSAADVSGKIKLKYKAKVFNDTGNDWSNVKLTLSTANPSLTATAPILDAWFLNSGTVRKSLSKANGYIVPQNRSYSQWSRNAKVPSMSQNLSGIGDFSNGGGKVVTPPVKFTKIEVPQLSTSFEIDKSYSIPSNSKPYLVEIQSFELPATFSHKAVPKLDRDAFLLANIVGWEKLNLISGPTHVYYQNNYVGESYLNTANVDDTLRLSFGRDEKIKLEKKLLEEFSSTNVIGSNKKDTYTYEITVKNNMDINLTMDLFDQIPISQESDITVSVDEISEALMSEETGILIWKVRLKPGEQKKYKVSFTIKYPKDKNIQVKKFRTISCPSF